MNEILAWALISGLLFLIFLTTLLWGLIKKRPYVLTVSLLSLLILFGTASRFVYLLASKSYQRISVMFTPRTGDEIYSALFGNTNHKCLRVLHHADQVIPKIDNAIWLYVETCPDELSRILQRHPFKVEKQSTQGWMPSGPSVNTDWFKPQSLGDSIWVFIYNLDEYGNGQTIYSSLDSTKAFCIDVLD